MENTSRQRPRRWSAGQDGGPHATEPGGREPYYLNHLPHNSIDLAVEASNDRGRRVFGFWNECPAVLMRCGHPQTPPQNSRPSTWALQGLSGRLLPVRSGRHHVCAISYSQHGIAQVRGRAPARGDVSIFRPAATTRTELPGASVGRAARRLGPVPRHRANAVWRSQEIDGDRFATDQDDGDGADGAAEMTMAAAVRMLERTRHSHSKGWWAGGERVQPSMWRMQ